MRGAFIAVFVVGSLAVANLEMPNYLQWVLGGVIVTPIALAIVILLNVIVYRNDVKQLRLKKR